MNLHQEKREREKSNFLGLVSQPKSLFIFGPIRLPLNKVNEEVNIRNGHYWSQENPHWFGEEP